MWQAERSVFCKRQKTKNRRKENERSQVFEDHRNLDDRFRCDLHSCRHGRRLAWSGSGRTLSSIRPDVLLVGGAVSDAGRGHLPADRRCQRRQALSAHRRSRKAHHLGRDCGSVLHSEHSPEHGQRRRIQFYEHLDRRSRSGSVHLRRSAEQQDRGRVCGIKKKKQNNEKKRSFVCTPAVYRDRVGSIGSQQVGAFPKQFGREL